MNNIIISIPEYSRVFVLDDSLDRLYWFERKLRNCVFDSAMTATDAIKLLNMTVIPYDVIFLDHDLDNVMRVDGSTGPNGDGYEVARHIAGMIDSAPVRGAEIFVHTWNPYGAERIMKVLTNSRRAVFGEFDIEIKRP